jgi:hypothetical protein
MNYQPCSRRRVSAALPRVTSVYTSCRLCQRQESNLVPRFFKPVLIHISYEGRIRLSVAQARNSWSGIPETWSYGESNSGPLPCEGSALPF